MNKNRTDEMAANDSKAMLRAVELAYLGLGAVEPNPMVGCTVVKNGVIVAEGFHARFGGPHAEVQALSPLSSDLVAGSTVFITLEPCSHFGKTPPCADLLIKCNPQRVVVGMEDPNPLVAGQGIAKLREHGITVDVGMERKACERLVRPYLKRLSKGLPWVIAKWAMTLDGRMATFSGDSKWITGEASRQHAHRTRGRVDSIVVGIETALRDDPLLTARPAGSRIAMRIVMDSLARLPVSSQLVQTANKHPTLVCCGPDASATCINQLRRNGCEVWIEESRSPDERLAGLLEELCRRGQTNVLFDGGPRLLGGLFDQRCVDEVHTYIACKMVGGNPQFVPNLGRGLEWMQTAMKLREVEHRSFDDDFFIQGVCEWAGGDG
jgi:diaminohydroxyphosphoribosylaminopyrimidine deaminase/5-amino-6-(5-phosphoribosylamino)uracil reductase